jgi:hypothetical protein
MRALSQLSIATEDTNAGIGRKRSITVLHCIITLQHYNGRKENGNVENQHRFLQFNITIFVKKKRRGALFTIRILYSHNMLSLNSQIQHGIIAL